MYDALTTRPRQIADPVCEVLASVFAAIERISSRDAIKPNAFGSMAAFRRDYCQCSTIFQELSSGELASNFREIEHSGYTASSRIVG